MQGRNLWRTYYYKLTLHRGVVYLVQLVAVVRILVAIQSAGSLTQPDGVVYKEIHIRDYLTYLIQFFRRAK